jgi:3',5'-cyclic AMP phosphodiesterase CpdA
MIVMAHLSDTHLDGGERSAERTARTMAYLNDLPRPIDAVLVTGDIADHGRPAEYREAAELLSASYPVLHCPGNHDAREPYREILLGLGAGGEPINQVHQVAGAVFAMCDSTIPGRDDGYLADETIAWLENVLGDASGDAPVFVAFHHPPVTLGVPFIERIRQQGEERLADLASRHPRIVAFLCGHAHTPAATTFAGRPLLVAPAVASMLKLPWESGDVLDHHLPPAIAFHILDDDGRLTTHYRVIA